MFIFGKDDIGTLKHLSSTDAFLAMKRLAGKLIAEWGSQPTTGETEFEYLRNSIAKDARQEGIRMFIAAIENTNDDKK